MAFLFCDSFDHYTAVTQKWSAGGTIGAFGRNATNGLRHTNAAPQSNTRIFAASQATLICGFAFRPTAVGADNVQIVGFHDVGSLQCEVRYDSSTGKLRVTRNNTTLATGTSVLASGTYYYIEFKVTFHDTTGSYTLRLNGTVELTATAQDTQTSANASADRVVLFGSGGSVFGSADWDDLYVCNTTGTVNIDFLGDSRVDALMPNGNGNYSQLLGSDANSTDNYLLVDETPPNDDTDYVESSTLNQLDTYAFGNLGANAATVHAVQTVLLVRKTDAGARSVGAVIRSGTTDSVGATKALSTTFAYELEPHDTNPAAAGAAWTPTSVNALEVGVKVVV